MEWYEKFPKLPAEDFTHENSGARSDEPPPWKEIHDYNRGMIGIEGLYGTEKVWKPIGYTFDVPRPDCRHMTVAIMFENRGTFEKIWWHFSA